MTLTQKQLEKIKEIHETLKESGDLLDKTRMHGTRSWSSVGLSMILRA